MSENDRTSERPAGRPKVKVTDRRRVREEGGAPTTPPSTPSDTPVSGDRPSTSEPELAAARKEAAEYRDHLMRLQAEFDNYRKRMLKEQTRALELAAEPIVRRMLEVLDEFELALMAAEQKPDFDRFLHGVELVYAKLLDTLGAEGLERIDAEGKPFDPERHEALIGSGAGDGEPVVADVLRQGYTLKGRVVRPAGVRVTHER
ncbi:MAG TPA: nucleotide exchange factor GrpE [Actinomycetota bacterium]|jgi:molecular chaperone GrpE